MRTQHFNSLGAFVAHLATVPAALATAQRNALDLIGAKIAADARAKIGTYQRATNGFVRWAPLAQSTEAEKRRLGYPTGAPLLRDGTLRASIQHEMLSSTEVIVGSKSDIAAYQEFGTSRIPPRPFIGPAAMQNAKLIQQVLGAAVIEGLSAGVTLASPEYRKVIP